VSDDDCLPGGEPGVNHDLVRDTRGPLHFVKGGGKQDLISRRLGEGYGNDSLLVGIRGYLDIITRSKPSIRQAHEATFGIGDAHLRMGDFF